MPRTRRTKEPTARDLAKQETREALIVAGIAAIASEGIDTPSLDAICARAGYTRGAFYVHFRDRDDFLIAVMEHILQGFIDAIIATGDAALDLRNTIEAYCRAVDEGAFPLRGAVPLHQFLAACARSPRIRVRYVEVLREASARVAHTVEHGQKAGTVRPDVNPRHVADLLVAITLGVQSMVEVDYGLALWPTAKDVMRLLDPSSTG